MLDFSTMLYRLPALLIALTFHEYAHALCADAMGDRTPRALGRLSMNPMAHLDVFGTIMLVICGFGWAKPVPINPNNFRNYKEGIMKVSFAGPGANLAITFLAVLLMAAMGHFGMLSRGVGEFLRWTMMYNVWFAFFNLIPIPPLDGSKILLELLPPRQAYAYEGMVGQYSNWILIALVFSGAVGFIIGPFANGFVGLCYTIARIIF